MKIHKREDERKIYSVVPMSKKVHAVVRVLNYYTDEKEANRDFLKVVSKEITEDELIQRLTKSDW